MTALDDLPTEILEMIVAWLDPADDATALTNLMRTSKTIWEKAARRLYADLTFEEKQVMAMFTGSAPQPLLEQTAPYPVSLSQRTRTALSFTHRLTFIGPWRQAVLDVVWNAATPNRPLFPNARQVFFDMKPPHGRRRDDVCQPNRCDGKFVFDKIDVCVLGKENLHALVQLPARRYRSITGHDVDAYVLLDYFLAHAAKRTFTGRWQCFQSVTDETLSDVACGIQTAAERRFPARWTLKAPAFPFRVHVKDGIKLGRKIASRYDETQSGFLKVFSHCTDIVQIRHYRLNGAGASPCTLCGKSDSLRSSILIDMDENLSSPLDRADVENRGSSKQRLSVAFHQQGPVDQESWRLLLRLVIWLRECRSMFVRRLF